MIYHYLRLAKKTLVKHKYYTFINVFGLVCGMLSVLVISKYIGASLQYDQFHASKNSIYTLNQREEIDGSEQGDRTSTYWGIGDVVGEFPEVTRITRYNQHVEALVISKSRSIIENRIFVTDSSFLKIFSFPILDGDRKDALSQPNSLVITKSASKRYFGDESPIGEVLRIRVSWGEESVYQITAVVDDVPAWSRFKFEFLVAPHVESVQDRLWNSPDYATYVLTADNADVHHLQNKLESKLENVPELLANKRHLNISLNSIADVQLSVTEYLLVAVGIFILIVCWVNYINQVIAQSYWRIKEIGVLRVLGATRINLQLQFVTESCMVCLSSLFLVLGAFIGMEERLSTLTNGHVLPLGGMATPTTLIFVLIFLLGMVMTAAIQTAILVVPNFGTSLQNAFNNRIGGVSARKSMVVIQFSISTILVICIFVVARQMKFLEEKDKGVDMRDVLVIRAPMVKDTTWNVKRERLKVFKEVCSQLPIVTGVTSSATVPGEEYRNETHLSRQDNAEKFLVHRNGVDDNYFRLYKVEFIAGRDFTPNSRFENNGSIILNESAARGLGIHDFEKAIDSKIVDHEEGEVFNLIGIVKDYHQTSLKYKMEPTAFRFNVFRGHISMRLNIEGVGNSEFEQHLTKLAIDWHQLYGDASFDYYFLEERFDAMNREDRYLGKLFYYFTALSIIISCLGLFSMSLFISEKRQKEIGIRKVFGASAADVLKIFFEGYVGPLLVAVAIGVPFGYWLMETWLTDYSYRIEIGVGLVTAAVVSIIVIFFLTVTYHTVQSARANPVDVLKD